ncbi:MAG: hypothetical protein QRY74_02330 [Chlamydia sp.]
MLTAEPEFKNQSPVNAQRRATAKILLYASILQEPLSVLILLLPFLIIKELNATTIHISAVTALAPTIAIISFYWSSIFKSSSQILRINLVISTCSTAALFLLAPIASNPWFFVVASTCYTLFFRAANPARMELLKRNIPENQRERIYSWTYKISYATGMILGPFFGLILDREPDLWKPLFVFSATMYMLSGWLYCFIPIDEMHDEIDIPRKDLSKVIIGPWKKSFEIIQKNSRFAKFQVGFFIAGFGLMLAKPAGDWFLGNLDISYQSLLMCRTFLKGLGVLGTIDIWSKHLKPTTILQLAHLIAWGFLLYNLLLMGTPISVSFLYLAYFVYGIAQSGSHLIWNLSGTLLSGKDSSYQYSAVNIVAVGIRGCIAPVLGCIFLNFWGVMPTLFFGVVIMFLGARYLAQDSSTLYN